MSSDAQLTPHFNLREFRCRCCGLVDQVTALHMAEYLEQIRSDTGPLTLVSGHRCRLHNAAVGGKPKSWHLLGLAVDILTVNDADRYRLIRSLIFNACAGIGIAADHIHVDRGVRPTPLLWHYYA